MTLDEILALIRAAGETDFDKFELRDEQFSLKLERRNYRLALEREGAPIFISNAELPASVQEQTPRIEADASAPESPAGTADSREITSPLIGMFHELPDGKAVKVGDRLKKGEVVCMIEAMKLMNEILMPEDGEIVWAGVKDNSMVEFGDLLYRYAV